MGIKNISLFSYKTFWRVSGQKEHAKTFGGIASILIYMLVGGIFLMNVVQTFQKTRITTSQNTRKSEFPPMVNITTEPASNTSNQFMLGINLIQFRSENYTSFATANLAFQANYVIQELNYTTVNKLVLEKCTPKHFNKMA